MKWYWKISIGLVFLVIFGGFIDIGLNAWLKHQLPKILNKNNHSAYAITYKKINVSLWDRNIDASDIIVVPRTALKDTLTKAGIYARVQSVAVADFKIWPMLFGDKIKARSITINKPEVTLYRKSKKAVDHSKTLRESVVAPFDQLIAVTDIFLHHGELRIVDAEQIPQLSVSNINLTLDGVVITDAILKHKIPFVFKNYKFDCDSLYYHPNAFYHIRTRKIATTNNQLTLDHFEMKPQYSRVAFVRQIPKEKDLYTLSAEKIAIDAMDWGFKGDDFFFHTKNIGIDKPFANIYRSKLPPDDLKKKKLYNRLLRELKFDLKVEQLKLRNATIEYEESKDFNKGAGKVSFNKFYLTATNICSGFKRTKADNVKINIKCRFMNESPLDVSWRFNVMDQADSFNIKGTLTNFDMAKMVSFTKPYMNATIKGVIDELHFNFNGNDLRNSGDFAIKYDDLKLTVYKKKDREKKNRLLTFVGNLLVKNDTKGKIKNAHVELDRVPDKSFFNFLWRSVEDGLKQILM